MRMSLGLRIPTFSIVIPVFNAEPYLAACLDSVLGQDYRRFEIICIDDGSTDGSSEILNQYSKRDKRVHLERQPNSGVSAARNKGISLARGKYIFFLDADDYIADGSLTYIKGLIDAYSPDIVVVGGASTPPSYWDFLMKTRDVVYRDDSISALLDERGARPLIAGKVYRGDLIKSRNILLDEDIRLGEDQAFQFATFPYAQCIAFGESTCYYYRQRPGSAMALIEEDRFGKLMLHFKLVRSILGRLQENNILTDHSPEFAGWFLDFIHDDLLALPSKQSVAALDEFNRVLDQYFSQTLFDERLTKMIRDIQSVSDPIDPIISIIVPVYNSEKYLKQSFESICRQTMRRFEVIYVDDGSTDSSRELLSSFETLDERVRVVFQEHSGAGNARNTGIDLAQGSYLLFLDSDDLFDPDMLESMLTASEMYNSDVCVCRVRGFDANTGSYIPLPWTCDLSGSEFRQPFSRKTEKDMIYCFTSPAPWNKLFRTSFVKKHDLRFQNLPNSNDTRFVILAISLSDRIVALERELMSYRINNSGSIQGSKRKHPLAFFEALTSIKEHLEDARLYEELERPFANFAFDFCVYNLETCARSDGGEAAFDTIFSFLRSEGLSRLGLLGKDESSFYAYSGINYLWYSDLLSTDSLVDFAKKRNLPPYSELESKDKEIASLLKEISRLRQEKDEVYSSYSYRIGSMLLSPLRKIREGLNR